LITSKWGWKKQKDEQKHFTNIARGMEEERERKGRRERIWR